MTNSLLYAAYLDYAGKHREYRPLTEVDFGKFTTRMAYYKPGQTRRFGGPHHAKNFGPLDLARQVFEHETGIGVDWDAKPEVWKDGAVSATAPETPPPPETTPPGPSDRWDNLPF